MDEKPFDPNDFLPPVIQDPNFTAAELQHLDVIAALRNKPAGIDSQEYLEALRAARLSKAIKQRNET
jgi:hypothetical protein